MITFSSNASEVMTSIINKIKRLGNTDQLLRNMATDLLPVVRSRIHTDGIAADGNGIGTYSPGYMVVRTGAFKNKGKKDSGFFTKGKQSIFDTKSKKAVKVKKSKDSVGSIRPNFNRTNDTKVVASLTRQMENDWSVIPTEKGYGLGFKNEENAKKMEHVEKTYDKSIAALTESERASALASAEDYKNRILNGEGK